MRLLGIDYGEKRIGIALGDTDTRLAGPLLILEQKQGKDWIEELLALIQQEQIEGLVFGIPRPLADQARETDQARHIQRVIEKVKERTSIPIHTQNETWTSVEAERQAQEIGSKKKRDDLAAALILQNWLDRHI